MAQILYCVLISSQGETPHKVAVLDNQYSKFWQYEVFWNVWLWDKNPMPFKVHALRCCRNSLDKQKAGACSVMSRDQKQPKIEWKPIWQNTYNTYLVCLPPHLAYFYWFPKLLMSFFGICDPMVNILCLESQWYDQSWYYCSQNMILNLVWNINFPPQCSHNLLLICNTSETSCIGSLTNIGLATGQWLSPL